MRYNNDNDNAAVTQQDVIEAENERNNPANNPAVTYLEVKFGKAIGVEYGDGEAPATLRRVIIDADDERDAITEVIETTAMSERTWERAYAQHSARTSSNSVAISELPDSIQQAVLNEFGVSIVNETRVVNKKSIDDIKRATA